MSLKSIALADYNLVKAGLAELHAKIVSLAAASSGKRNPADAKALAALSAQSKTLNDSAHALVPSAAAPAPKPQDAPTTAPVAPFETSLPVKPGTAAPAPKPVPGAGPVDKT
jgi:hypothetical protein